MYHLHSTALSPTAAAPQKGLADSVREYLYNDISVAHVIQDTIDTLLHMSYYGA